MLSTVLVRNSPVTDNIVDVTVDWESPAGGDTSPFARSGVQGYVFDGPGDAHWIGQPCGVIQSEDHESPMVVLACGCRTRTPWSSLK